MDTSLGLGRNIDNNFHNGNIRFGNRQCICSRQQRLRFWYCKNSISFGFYRHTCHPRNNHGKHSSLPGFITDLQHWCSHRSNLLHMDTSHGLDRHINNQFDNGNSRINKR